jgi:hypothetical protein
MLTATNLSRATNPAGAIAMTFRVYVRWPGQQVTDRTSTESRAIAEAAYAELVKNAETFKTKGALGITFTESGKQVGYEELNEEADGPPGRKAR